MPKKIKCLWFEDHDDKKHDYIILDFSFGVCNICKIEARKSMHEYQAPRPRKRKKIRKARKR